MKYLCLAYYDEKKAEALSKEDWDEIGKQCQPLDDVLRKSGHLIAHGSLQPPRMSTIVRPRNGKVSVTDGPFVETKEQVGGFFIIDARDLNEAIRIASNHPAGQLNEHLGWGVEVRPMDFFEQP